MEYTLTYNSVDDPKSFSYTVTLTEDQLGGIITFMFMYLYDRYAATKGDLNTPEFERMYNMKRGQDQFTEFTVSSAAGPEDIWELENNTNVIPILFENRWTIKRLGPIIEPVINYVNTNPEIQQVMFHNYMTDIYEYRLNQDHKLLINEMFPPNRNVPITIYTSVFASNNTLAYKEFNNLEYLQGFMSIATWLGLDYRNYIKAIFENGRRVVIA